MAKTAKTREETYLQPGKKVTLMPVLRSGPMIKDKSHAGFWKYDGTVDEFVVPLSRNNVPVSIFESDAEKKFFEDKIGKDLSIGKTEDNFWHKFSVNIQKDEGLLEHGLPFDLGDPLDMLKVKVLRANKKKVADGMEEKDKSPKVRYVLVEEGYHEKKQTKRASLNNRAYRFFSKVDGDPKEMYKFITLYYLENNNASRPPEDASLEKYQAMMQDIIDNDIEGFVSLVEDEDRDMKLMIWDGLVNNIIQKEGSNRSFQFITEDGPVFAGQTLNNVVEWLKDPKNSIHLQRLRTLTQKKDK